MKDDIDNWFFNKLIKSIIDSLILLLRLIRPNDKKPKPKPDNPIPDKPMFPWLRKQIDNIYNIFKEKK